MTNKNILTTAFCSQDTGVDKRKDGGNIKQFSLQHYYIHSKSAEVWMIITSSLKGKNTPHRYKHLLFILDFLIISRQHCYYDFVGKHLFLDLCFLSNEQQLLIESVVSNQSKLSYCIKGRTANKKKLKQD